MYWEVLNVGMVQAIYTCSTNFRYNVYLHTLLQEPAGYKARYDVNVKQLRFVDKAK